MQELQAKSTGYLLYNRSLLEDMLKETCRKGGGTCYSFGVSACIYQIVEPSAMTRIRHQIHGLNKLAKDVEEHSLVDFKKQHGLNSLWLPAIIDEEQGDAHVTVNESDNWITKHMDQEEMAEAMRQENDNQLHLQALEAFGKWPILRLCCRSGKTRRLRILNSAGHSRLSALFGYAVVLGKSVNIHMPSKRPRSKRTDALRGRTDEDMFLFEFDCGRRHWMVYQPNSKVLEKYREQHIATGS